MLTQIDQLKDSCFFFLYFLLKEKIFDVFYCFYQVVEKPALELDFGYHSLDRSVVDSIGDTESPRPLHTVEESLNESSSREELRSISASSGNFELR